MALNMPSHTTLVIFFLIIIRTLSPGYMRWRDGSRLPKHRDFVSAKQTNILKKLASG